MKLGAWLKANDMLPSDFADAIGVDKSLVSRWLDGSVTPRRKNKALIRVFTKGKVTANDFEDDQEPIPNLNSSSPVAAE